MVEMEQNIMINASYIPNEALVNQIKNLKENQAIFDGDTMVAFYSLEDQEIDFNTFKTVKLKGTLLKVETTWDIFSKNGEAIEADFKLLTANRISAPIPEQTVAFNSEAIFIEDGA